MQIARQTGRSSLFARVGVRPAVGPVRCEAGSPYSLWSQAAVRGAEAAGGGVVIVTLLGTVVDTTPAAVAAAAFWATRTVHGAGRHDGHAVAAWCQELGPDVLPSVDQLRALGEAQGAASRWS